MELEIILIILTAAITIFAALETTNKNGTPNYKGISVIIFAVGLGVISFIKTRENAVKEKEKDEQISELQTKLSVANSALSRIDTNILNEKRLLYPSVKMDLAGYDSDPIPYPLVEGMSINIMHQNCDDALVFLFNGKEKRIRESPFEFRISEDIVKDGAEFHNKSEAICSVTYEVFGTLKMQMDAISKSNITKTEEEDGPVDNEKEPIAEVKDSDEIENEDNVDEAEVLPVDIKTHNKEMFYVSIGCYKNRNKEIELRKLFNLNKNEKIILESRGSCFMYLVGTGKDSERQVLRKAEVLRRSYKDCFAIALRREDGELFWRKLE